MAAIPGAVTIAGMAIGKTAIAAESCDGPVSWLDEPAGPAGVCAVILQRLVEEDYATSDQDRRHRHMPVCQNQWPNQGNTQNDDRGDHDGTPSHGAAKSALGTAGGPGERQDSLERPKGQKEQNSDIPVAQLKDHKNASTSICIKLSVRSGRYSMIPNGRASAAWRRAGAESVSTRPGQHWSGRGTPSPSEHRRACSI